MGTFLIQTNRDFLFTHFVKSIISNNLWLYNYFFIDIKCLCLEHQHFPALYLYMLRASNCENKCLYWCFLPVMLISSMCNYVLWCTYIVKIYNWYWLKISVYTCIHSTITFVLFWFQVIWLCILGYYV